MKNNFFDFDKKTVENYSFIVGTDEAGRGPGAGGVYAAAVFFPNPDKKLQKLLADINDSKKLDDKKREELYPIITENAVYDIAFGSVEEIAETNILQTSLNCMKKACCNVIAQLKDKNVLVLVDGNRLIPEFSYSQKYVVHGDGKSASIAAASILAKVTRDRYMQELDREFPNYKWSQNKGYMTPEHLEAVDRYGLTKYHRTKFFEKHFNKQLSLF